jgi:hypothetical protein
MVGRMMRDRSNDGAGKILREDRTGGDVVEIMTVKRAWMTAE